MTIGITGAAGMIGWHAACVLRSRQRPTKLATRSTFADEGALDDFVIGCDAIIHLAGMNRGDDDEIESTNVALTRSLLDACDRTGVVPHIVFANSTHAGRDDAYGRSKRESSVMVERWAETRGVSHTDLVLPHVFGERGRPFYNSVVHTFCHQLTIGERPEIVHDGELELVHARDAVLAALASIDEDASGLARVPGERMLVSDLLRTLEQLHGQYADALVPELDSSPLVLQLFNVLRSFRFPDSYPMLLTEHRDHRGSFFEIAKSTGEGQTSFSTTAPGVTRGNHFHLRKVERFVVVSGTAEIRLRRLFDDQVVTFRVDGSTPCAVDMPTLHTHSITNVGTDELLTLFWISEIYDDDDPDTFAEPVAVEP